MIVDTITGEVVDPKNYSGVWFSASLLSDMESCPAKAFGRITKQVVRNPGIALINGSAIHSGIENFLVNGTEPMKGYLDYFNTECEKQGLNANNPDYAVNKADAEKMLAAAQVQLSKPGFQANLDPSLVERKFRVARNGRIFVGKIDLIYFKNREEGRYAVTDWKSGKTAPKQFELDSSIQFNMYPWATYHDQELPTKGLWAERAVWYHLRGKNVGVDSITGKTTRKEAEKKWKFDFPTMPTPESVEQIFKDTIEPLCQDIEDGRWRRKRSDDCNYCNFFEKSKQRCGVELPNDGLAERGNQISLLDMANPRQKAVA